MTQGELFAGIGGFGLAGRRAGIESVFQVEWNNYCQKILKKNFPNAALYSDIREFDGTPYRGAIDIISGGFPCQPYSTAGKRLGKEDDRHLWPEMLRVIREVAPRWVVGENVRGLVNWSGGLVFDEVQADLEAAGYEVFAAILPAASVNAPHRRDRIWFVAYSEENRKAVKRYTKATGQQVSTGRYINGQINKRTTAYSTRIRQEKRTHKSNRKNTAKNRTWVECPTERPRNAWATPNTSDIGRQRSGAAWDGRPGLEDGCNQWQQFPTQSPVCGGNDGISNRVDRIAALGNAIVPQVAYQIFKSIKDYDCQTI